MPLRMRARPERRRRAALIVGGLVAGLILTEIALRIALPPTGYRFPSFRMTDDRFTTRAGRSLEDRGLSYVFDAEGFRVTDSAPDPADRSILFVGDSFTEGLGVAASEAFPAVACARLQQRGMDIRCLNAGVSGFGTAHELRLLQRLLQRRDLAIRAVVFQVLPNNDLRDNWEDGGFAIEADRLVVRDPARPPWRVWLRDFFLDNELARGSRMVTLVANASFDGVGMDPGYDDDSYAMERELLRAVVTTTTAHQVGVVFLVAATAWELDRQVVQRFDERDRLDFVANAVAQLGVPWIDSRTVAASSAQHYIPGDGHFSVAGNALIGEALAAQLAPLL